MEEVFKRQIAAVGQAVKDRYGNDWDVDTLREYLKRLVMSQAFTLDVVLRWLILNVDDGLAVMLIRDWVYEDVDETIWKHKSWEQRQKESIEALKNA